MNDILKTIIYNLLKSFIISTIIFAIYVEINPSMGNIWYRIDSNGIKRINIISLFNLMLGPLRYLFYWNLTNLDINFFIHWLVVFLIIQFNIYEKIKKLFT